MHGFPKSQRPQAINSELTDGGDATASLVSSDDSSVKDSMGATQSATDIGSIASQQPSLAISQQCSSHSLRTLRRLYIHHSCIIHWHLTARVKL